MARLDLSTGRRGHHNARTVSIGRRRNISQKLNRLENFDFKSRADSEIQRRADVAHEEWGRGDDDCEQTNCDRVGEW
jgi:hypothetical protein